MEEEEKKTLDSLAVAEAELVQQGQVLKELISDLEERSEWSTVELLQVRRAIQPAVLNPCQLPSHLCPWVLILLLLLRGSFEIFIKLIFTHIDGFSNVEATWHFWDKFKLTMMYNGASQVALVVKNLPANAGDIIDLGLISGMASYSSILVWRIPWTQEPGRLQSVKSERVRHD